MKALDSQKNITVKETSKELVRDGYYKYSDCKSISVEKDNQIQQIDIDQEKRLYLEQNIVPKFIPIAIFNRFSEKEKDKFYKLAFTEKRDEPLFLESIDFIRKVLTREKLISYKYSENAGHEALEYTYNLLENGQKKYDEITGSNSYINTGINFFKGVYNYFKGEGNNTQASDIEKIDALFKNKSDSITKELASYKLIEDFNIFLANKYNLQNANLNDATLDVDSFSTAKKDILKNAIKDKIIKKEFEELEANLERIPEHLRDSNEGKLINIISHLIIQNQYVNLFDENNNNLANVRDASIGIYNFVKSNFNKYVLQNNVPEVDNNIAPQAKEPEGKLIKYANIPFAMNGFFVNLPKLVYYGGKEYTKYNTTEDSKLFVEMLASEAFVKAAEVSGQAIGNFLVYNKDLINNVYEDFVEQKYVLPLLNSYHLNDEQAKKIADDLKKVINNVIDDKIINKENANDLVHIVKSVFEFSLDKEYNKHNVLNFVNDILQLGMNSKAREAMNHSKEALTEMSEIFGKIYIDKRLQQVSEEKREEYKNEFAQFLKNVINSDISSQNNLIKISDFITEILKHDINVYHDVEYKDHIKATLVPIVSSLLNSAAKVDGLEETLRDDKFIRSLVSYQITEAFARNINEQDPEKRHILGEEAFKAKFNFSPDAFANTIVATMYENIKNSKLSKDYVKERDKLIATLVEVLEIKDKTVKDQIREQEEKQRLEQERIENIRKEQEAKDRLEAEIREKEKIKANLEKLKTEVAKEEVKHELVKEKDNVENILANINDVSSLSQKEKDYIIKGLEQEEKKEQIKEPSKADLVNNKIKKEEKDLTILKKELSDLKNKEDKRIKEDAEKVERLRLENIRKEEEAKRLKEIEKRNHERTLQEAAKKEQERLEELKIKDEEKIKEAAKFIEEQKQIEAQRKKEQEEIAKKSVVINKPVVQVVASKKVEGASINIKAATQKFKDKKVPAPQVQINVDPNRTNDEGKKKKPDVTNKFENVMKFGDLEIRIDKDNLKEHGAEILSQAQKVIENMPSFDAKFFDEILLEIVKDYRDNYQAGNIKVNFLARLFRALDENDFKNHIIPLLKKIAPDITKLNMDSKHGIKEIIMDELEGVFTRRSSGIAAFKQLIDKHGDDKDVVNSLNYLAPKIIWSKNLAILLKEHPEAAKSLTTKLLYALDDLKEIVDLDVHENSPEEMFAAADRFFKIIDPNSPDNNFKEFIWSLNNPNDPEVELKKTMIREVFKLNPVLEQLQLKPEVLFKALNSPSKLKHFKNAYEKYKDAYFHHKNSGKKKTPNYAKEIGSLLTKKSLFGQFIRSTSHILHMKAFNFFDVFARNLVYGKSFNKMLSIGNKKTAEINKLMGKNHSRLDIFDMISKTEKFQKLHKHNPFKKNVVSRNLSGITIGSEKYPLKDIEFNYVKTRNMKVNVNAISNVFWGKDVDLSKVKFFIGASKKDASKTKAKEQGIEALFNKIENGDWIFSKESALSLLENKYVKKALVSGKYDNIKALLETEKYNKKGQERRGVLKHEIKKANRER